MGGTFVLVLELLTVQESEAGQTVLDLGCSY